MHVLLVSTSFPESLGGSEAAGGFVADFAEALAGHMRVTVVAATAGASSVENAGSIQVHRFNVPRWPLSLLRPHQPSDWWPTYVALRDGMKAVRAIVAADRPDYVLALWALPSGYWAREMLRKYEVPYGVWALGSDIWSLGRIPVLRSFLRRVLSSASHRWADGLDLGERVQELCGLPCEFLPSARRLPVRSLTDPADAPPYKLAYLGRWHPNKGVDIFLRALLLLSADDWANIAEVRLHGGGPLESKVHGLVRELQERDRPVSAGGYLDSAAAADFIAWSDYLVLPSRVESIPVIFSDAAQLRRPLVATPVGDLPRLFEKHEFGFLAAGISADDFAAALRKAIWSSASRFHSQLADVSSKFDIVSIAEQFANNLESSLK